MDGEGEVNAIQQWYDLKAKRTRYVARCHVCGRQFNSSSSPRAALEVATKKGFDEASGMCRLCLLRQKSAEAAAAA
jgi:hypothetical protein